jgi:putative ABC transport system substrate-binding protein
MIAAADPVRSGLVASWAHPGGNTTGLANIAPELAGKRLELLKEIIPALSPVAVLWNPGDASATLSFKETQAAARALGVQLLSLEARGPNDFARAFEGAVRGQARALTVLSDALMFNYRTRIVELAIERRLPAVHTHRGWAEAGALLSYGPDFADLWRRAAGYVDKILKGAKPGDLPVEQPTKFDLVINLKTAKALGLTIPQSLLGRADEVIQ